MDGTRIDDIARQLGTARSRRGVLKTLGAATLGAIGVAGLSRAAAAAPTGNVLVCHHTGSASNPYVLISVSPNAVPTFAAQGDATNVDLQTDPNNCGSCGNVCTTSVANATGTCSGGTCTDGYTCESGYYPSGPGCCYNYQSPAGACYWMEDYSGDYCWVPADIGDQASCEAANGCYPGSPGGGCYKWATSSAG